MKEGKYILLLSTSSLLAIIMAVAFTLISSNLNTSTVAQNVIIEETIPEPIVIIEPETQSINDSFDIMKPSNLSYDDLVRSLGNSRYGIESSLEAILNAEHIYGVNALYLTAVLGFESGWGEYETGLNNIAGWKGDHGNFSNFDSRYECIMTVAEGLTNDFILTQGSDIYNVSLRYCTDYLYLETLLQIMQELENNIKNRGL